MQKPQQRQYDMLVRVRDFGIAHRDRFPASTLGGDAFAAVEAAVKDLDEQAVIQRSNRREVRGGPVLKTAEGAALIEMLEAISRTAKGVALDRPEVEVRFRVPEKMGKATLLNVARTFACDAGPFADAFIAHGMPRDFVAQLTARIEGFDQTLTVREAVRQRESAARASIARVLESGLAAVQRLDAIVANIIGGDDGAVAAWETARRVEHHGAVRSSKANVAAAPVSPTAPPATPDAGSTGTAAESPAAVPAPIDKVA